MSFSKLKIIEKSVHGNSLLHENVLFKQLTQKQMLCLFLKTTLLQNILLFITATFLCKTKNEHNCHILMLSYTLAGERQ